MFGASTSGSRFEIDRDKISTDEYSKESYEDFQTQVQKLKELLQTIPGLTPLPKPVGQEKKKKLGITVGPKPTAMVKQKITPHKRPKI